MNVLFYGLLAFFLALLSHIAIWRVRMPKGGHTAVLLVLFFYIFAVSIIIFKMFPREYFFGINAPRSFFEYAQFTLLYASLALSYVVSYSAVEADSPSLVIVLNIVKAAPDGLREERLSKIMTDERLVLTRINDLIESGLVHFDRARYKLTPNGITLANIFIFYRGLLGLPKGG